MSNSVAANILGLIGADLEDEAIPVLATLFNTLAANQKQEVLLQGPADALALGQAEESLIAALPSAAQEIAGQANTAIQAKLASWLASAKAKNAAAGAPTAGPSSP